MRYKPQDKTRRARVHIPRLDGGLNLFDPPSAVADNQLTACTNVMGKYHNALMCGALDPEEILPKFIQELKDAGIDDIIADKQEQLDAWREANGK